MSISDEVVGAGGVSWELPKDVPTEDERLAAYAEWCANNPEECVLCNPHACDDYCQFCE